MVACRCFGVLGLGVEEGGGALVAVRARTVQCKEKKKKNPRRDITGPASDITGLSYHHAAGP